MRFDIFLKTYHKLLRILLASAKTVSFLIIAPPCCVQMIGTNILFADLTLMSLARLELIFQLKGEFFGLHKSILAKVRSAKVLILALTMTCSSKFRKTSCSEVTSRMSFDSSENSNFLFFRFHPSSTLDLFDGGCVSLLISAGLFPELLQSEQFSILAFFAL